MKYQELIGKVDELEKESELGECMYVKAIEKLRDTRRNLRRLDDVQDVQRVIKPFLIQWGMMGRVVGRQDLEWKRLGKTLRDLEGEFQKLRGKRLLFTNLDEEQVASAVKNIYRKLDPIPYLGSPTTISKILHLLNPELFVMWDGNIRKRYKKKNHLICDTPEGYLEFLKETQKELKEALGDHQRETGKGLDEVEQEIRKRYKNKTLARIVDEYDWMMAHSTNSN